MLTVLKSQFKFNLESIRFKSKRRRKKRIIFPKLRRRGGPRYKRSSLLPDVQLHLDQLKQNSWENMNYLRDYQIDTKLRRIALPGASRYDVVKRRVRANVTKYLVNRYSKHIRRLNKRRYKFAFGSKSRFPVRRHDESKFYNVYPRLRDRSRRARLARYNFFKIAVRPLLLEPLLNSAKQKAEKDYFFEVPQAKRKIRSLQRRLSRASKLYKSYLGAFSPVRWGKYESYKMVIKSFITPALGGFNRMARQNRRYRKFVWSRLLKFLALNSTKSLSKVKYASSRGTQQLSAYQQAYYDMRKMKPLQRRMLFRRRKRLIRFINYFSFITSRAGRWFRPRRLYIHSKAFRLYRNLSYHPLLKRLRSKRVKKLDYRYNVKLRKPEFRLRFKRRQPFSEGHRPESLRRAQTVSQFKKLRARRWRFWNLLRRVRKFRLIRRRYKTIGRYGEMQRGDLDVLPRIDTPIVELRETANNFYIVVKQNNQTLFDRTCGMVYPHGAPKFEGPKRRTPYAAEVLGKHVGRMLLMKQMPHIQLKIRTRPNEKVKAAIKGIKGVEIPVKFAALYKAGRLVRAAFHGVRRVHVDRVSINVPLSHNGLRRRKPRRI